MHKWIAALGLSFFLLACGDDTRAVETEGPLRIGVILPMSGNQSTYGEESWNGIQLALEDLKKNGFPKGVDWKLILKDEKPPRRRKAGNQAKLLIENEGVHVLIGSVASSNTEQIAVEAKESEVPLITPASTNDVLTVNGGPYRQPHLLQGQLPGRRARHVRVEAGLEEGRGGRRQGAGLFDRPRRELREGLQGEGRHGQDRVLHDRGHRLREHRS